MSVLSIFKCLKVDAKLLIPIIFFVGLLFKNVSSAISPVSDDEDIDVVREKLPFCDEKLIFDRDVSKR